MIDNVENQLNPYLDFNEEWTLYNGNPWEGFNGSTTKGNKKQEYQNRVIHIECRKGSGNIIKYQLCRWVIPGKAAWYFGDCVKVVNFITQNIPPGQVNRTVSMNSHGRRFQTSIDMVELQGIHNTNGKVSLSRGNYTASEIVLCRKIYEGNIFLILVTKKWGPYTWQATFVLKYQK